MAFPIAAAVGAGASLLGQVFNNSSQRRTNDRQERFAREMWDKQGQREVEYFNMQNAFNDPSAQMQRLQNAGLNPNLVYGNGATTEAAGLSPRGPQQPNFQAPQMDLGSVAQQAMMFRQADANIARTEAETEQIQSRTEGTEFQNEVNRLISSSKVAERYSWASDQIAINSQRLNAEYEAWKSSNFAGTSFDDPNSPLAKAQSAGLRQALEELENTKSRRTLQELEAEYKRFENNLMRAGISRNSPWFVKILGDLIMKFMPGMSESIINNKN